MQTDFRLFGPLHLAILAATPASALLLARSVRRGRLPAQRVSRTLGLLLAGNELIWYAWRLRTEGWRFPEGLPLQLCDLALWMTVLSALRRSAWSYELAYFAGLGGSTMALITPALWAPTFSYPTIYFFVAHGGVVATVLFLAIAGLARPRPGCWWRAFLLLNGYTTLVGLFNVAFGTNYMFLCRKPPTPSLLDYMGPWPVYIVVGEVFAVAVFALLYLPFAKRAR
ncbi:MAG: TIGR02206 family membrane protein [Bryobacterales bacterium]|nr:TIGR02206 family membrane protein [Bryobacteraceae bacterium]MDW8353831.1 TIGR02206 family membrane protein [Bryobacterales bacterium]